MVSVIFVLISAVVASALGMESSQIIEANPFGYLSDCPGSTKPAIITKKSLKHITMRVLQYGGELTAKKTRYTYFQTKQLMKDPDMDLKKKTMIFVEGYLDTSASPISSVIGQHYKDLGYNVLLMDGSRFMSFTHYPIACRFSRAAGVRGAEMLANLTRLGLDPKRMELIGVSLGAQTASFVAKNYHRQTGVKVSRLTGLDPAGPCFRHLGPDDRIDSSDADFVDIINTNIDGFGMAAPVGHVNWYINGGEFQPGDFIFLLCTTLCSHARSYFIWISSLKNPGKFIGMQCDSVQQARDKQCYNRQPRVTNVIGLDTDQSKPGIYYVSTTNAYPYYMEKAGLKKENEFYPNALKVFNTIDVMRM